MMKGLKKDLQSVLKELKTLTKKTEKMAKRLDRLAQVKPGKTPKAKAVPKVKRKRKKVAAIDTILAFIKKSKKGIDSATLKNKTGFKDSNTRTAIYRLRKQGKIKSERRGFYVKA